MNKNTLIVAFKSMLYVAKEEGLSDMLNEKYLNLEDELNYNFDLDVTDMIDNIENIYQRIIAIVNDINFDPEKMLKMIENDLLLHRMYNDLGKNKNTLETLFYSEVYGDSVMLDEYLSIKTK